MALTAAEKKAKAVTAAEKRLAVVQKRYDRAAQRVQSAEDLIAARDEAARQLAIAQQEVEWQRSRPTGEEGEGESPVADEIDEDADTAE